ncbi:MAG: UvrD-helicase domain-containing protein [Bacteroidales bacterium]|nr:UvrD-helicase domain-containing protein [Bacteroidales bacterium]
MEKLNIVRASAGSGKTFKLILEYLSHLYDNTGDFIHILAVTFTNKATEEMKSRIIGVLFELAIGMPSKYLEQLQERTGRTEKQIRLKSDVILKKILHNYSRFSVSTIDSFFQYIIRSFTHEIGIQGGYRIEMDDDLILQRAVDDLFIRIEHDKALCSWLTEFTENRIEESRSWNLKREILKLGSEIFKERYKQFSDVISKKLHNKDFLSDYRQQLFNIRYSFESALKEYGKQGMESISQNGLLVNDFYQKSRGPAGYFQKLENGDISVPGSYVMKTYEDIEQWARKDHPKWPFIRKICETSLHPLLQKAVSYYLENKKAYFTAKTLLRNFYSLGILADITRSVYNYVREKNLFMISDSAQFINRIIDNNDTPFIYEKTGNYFHHFLIDEFQDTSGFQWKNFKPLIRNSISENYSCLVVGDVKQSIYRWRNSNWEILAYDILDDFHAEEMHTETLGINWRSKKNIVSFNNAFFSLAPEILQQQFNNEKNTHNETDSRTIPDLYKDVKQDLPGNLSEDGYIRIGFYDETGDYDAKICAEVINIIRQLLDNGYQPSDIAILTRGKNEGKKIADYLLEHRQNQSHGSGYPFNVISDESLMLASAASVRFVVSLFRHMVEPENHVNNYFMLYEYLNHIKNSDHKTSRAIIPEYDSETAEASIRSILPEAYDPLPDYPVNRSLYEVLQEIIQVFSLNELRGEQAFLLAFKDMILDYTEYNSSSLPAFLDYWDETGSKKSIPGAEEQDAIRIMTIHKSKGLEFKAVIVPFCNWKINQGDTIIWCQPEGEPFAEMDILPVDYGKALKETTFAGDYYREKLKTYIDNLNLLYVAFTRAKTALYCFASADTGKPEDAIINVSQLVSGTLKHEALASLSFKTIHQQGFTIFEKGSPDKPGKEEKTISKSYYVEDYPESNTIERMKIAYHAREYLAPDEKNFHPLSYGKIMHELFSHIYELKDIEPAVENLYFDGKISGAEKKMIKKDMQSFFSDARVKSWFSGEWKVLNERDILTKPSRNKRPDRVLINEKSAVIIDYKFGETELKEHLDQVMEYADLLKQMGYEQPEMFLWYVLKRKIIHIGKENDEISLET